MRKLSTDPKSAFPKALQFYMSLNGKRQQDLIRDLHISSPTISQWVNGKMFPRMDKVEMLADYFHISTSDLLTDPYQRNSATADKGLIAQLIENNPALYELLRSAAKLKEPDLILLKGIADRLYQLQEGEP